MNDVGGPLIDAGRTVLMIPADMVLIAKLLAGSVVIIALAAIVRAAAHLVQAVRGNK